VYAYEEPAVEAGVATADRAVAALRIKAFVGEHDADYATGTALTLAEIGLGRVTSILPLSPRIRQVSSQLRRHHRRDFNGAPAPPYPGTS